MNTIATVVNKNENLVVLSFVEGHCHVADPNTEWVVDSVVSYYATPKRDVFAVYNVKDFSRVKMGNTIYVDISWKM